jgi:methyl-accepting chemotaxis protein
MNFKHMKVGTRLALGYAVVLILLAVNVGIGLLKMKDMQDRTTTITDVNNIQISLIGAMQDSVTDRMVALRNLGLLTAMDAMQAEVQRIRKQEAIYKDAMAKLGKTFEDPSTTPEEKAFFLKMQEQEAAALPLMAQAEKLGLANNADESTPLLMNKVDPAQNAWLGTLNSLARWEEKLNNDAARDARDTYHSAVGLMLVLTAMAIIAGIAAATLVTRALLKQLGGEPAEAARVAATIAAGDLTVEVAVKPNDRGSMMLAMRGPAPIRLPPPPPKSRAATWISRAAPSSRPARWKKPHRRWKS